jgi:hypothetical protein
LTSARVSDYIDAIDRRLPAARPAAHAALLTAMAGHNLRVNDVPSEGRAVNPQRGTVRATVSAEVQLT